MVDTKYFNKILGLLQADLNVEKTYAAICKLVEQAVSYESATLFMYDDELKKMESVYQSGDHEVDLVSQFNFGQGTGLSGWVSEQKKPVILPSLSKSRAGKDGLFQSFASLPLRMNNRLIGVMNLGHSQSDMYSKNDVPDFSELASQISLVLEQVKLRKELNERNQQLKETVLELETTQKELIEKERLAAIGEIVVTVNHNINNPLASIIGLTELLSMSIHTFPTEKVRKSLNLILTEAKRIEDVTKKLREIRTSDSGEYVDGVKMTQLPE